MIRIVSHTSTMKNFHGLFGGGIDAIAIPIPIHTRYALANGQQSLKKEEKDG